MLVLVSVLAIFSRRSGPRALSSWPWTRCSNTCGVPGILPRAAWLNGGKNMGISYRVLHPSNRKWIITPSTIEVPFGNL